MSTGKNLVFTDNFLVIIDPVMATRDEPRHAPRSTNFWLLDYFLGGEAIPITPTATRPPASPTG
jgi:hypothetical protein